ncbi:MAG: PEGA domain-containing protein [Planctomycetota bacterium]
MIARRRAALTLLAAGALPLAGCVERRIIVTSQPPGARVWLNDIEIGTTPAEAEFRFYGVYDVRLELDGYEPVHTGRKANAPVYEYPGPDVVAELLPVELENRVEWHFELEPTPEIALDRDVFEGELLDRARGTRLRLDEPD